MDQAEAGTETAPASLAPAQGAARRILPATWWLARLAAALFLFVGGLQVMKLGAGSLAIFQNEGLLVRNAGSTFGVGWIGALFVLSGSPIAASALTFVAAGTIDETQGFTMVVGSRLGAAFVVLLVAVVYAIRGGTGKRFAPVSTAVITLSTTAFVYLPGALIGLLLLRTPAFQSVNLVFPSAFGDLIDLVYGGALEALEGLPGVVLFLGGLGILLVSFRIIDSVVPELSGEAIESSRMAWWRRKWSMFALGCLVALVTMSVSVALTVLVPLVAKKYVKREEIVPYVIGANITTLGDTLLAAFLLESPEAVRIVIATITGTTLTSLALLAVGYPQLRRFIFGFQRRMVASRTRLAGFTAGLFLVPLTIVAISAVIR